MAVPEKVMSFKRTLVALATLATLSLPVQASAADSTGQKGSIESVEINHSTADTFLQYHGRIVVKNGKTTTEYRWGGTSCSNKTLPEELVALLYEAFRSRKTTHVTPRFQSGQGNNKCLVGFTLANNNTKKSGDDDDDQDSQ
jgi:hypothetical protein